MIPAHNKTSTTTLGELEQIPDWELQVGEPLMGWRAWAIKEHNGLTYLSGCFYKVRWPRRKPMRGHCMTMWGKWYRTGSSGKWPHNTPDSYHSCGVYATKEEARARNYAKQAHISVFGRVAMYGRIVKHEHGYRAEYAYPTQLWVIDKENVDAMDLAMVLESAYGVPTDVMEEPV